MRKNANFCLKYFKAQIIVLILNSLFSCLNKRTKRITLFRFCVHFDRQTFDSLLIPIRFILRSLRIKVSQLIYKPLFVRILLFIGKISYETFVTIQRVQAFDHSQIKLMSKCVNPLCPHHMKSISFDVD